MSVSRRTWALVAVKRFDRAKTRLAVTCDPTIRAGLAEAMLGDVLTALGSASALGGILVVTSDPAAAAIAKRAGADTLKDTLNAGVNPAVRLGLECLRSWEVARAIVVPADVPLLTCDEVDEIADALDAAAVVLAPAERDGGTNILAMSRLDALTPAFGEDSLRRHSLAARAAGIEPLILPLAGAGLDIDIPEHLETLLERDTRTRAAAFLRGCAAHATAWRPHPLSERIVNP